jgi:hypothetical protein
VRGIENPIHLMVLATSGNEVMVFWGRNRNIGGGMRELAIALLGIMTVLQGCTAIRISDVTPTQPAAANVCKGADMVVAQAAAAKFVKANSAKLKFSVETIQTTLPPAMQNDPVVKAFLQLTQNYGAKGLSQAESLYVALPTEVTQHADNPDPSNINQGDLKAFVKNVFKEEMKPRIMGVDSDSAASNGSFIGYFKAYYEGSFVDHLGTPIQRPTLSMTIPDTEIAAALTVLVEYIADNIDTTPVWGDKPTLADATTFYPGGSKKAPTVLSFQPTLYAQVEPGPCGMTTEKLTILGDLATAAGDAGGAVSGLVHGSFGGFAIGLGLLGKFSFGDNQTLANVVKAAASRLSMRLTAAVAWPILAKMDAKPVKEKAANILVAPSW